MCARARIIERRAGEAGIAHVRYPTAGSASAQEAQPFFVNSPLGIYMIHNGNLTNTEALREQLQGSQSFFNRHMRTTSDSEVLLNVLADEIHRAHQRCVNAASCDPNAKKMDFVFEAGASTMAMLKGSYSCICLVKGVGLVAFRDPHGIRPLVLGKRPGPKGDEWCVASEDCAFGPIGFERVRDVLPGEMVVVTPEGQLVARQCAPGVLNPCIFEYIYLARPDSVLNGISVYNFQLGLGTRLAQKIRETGWDIDIVVPVPDGSRPSAIQLSAELKLPYREGLVKNRYVGRTFIMPDQRLREMSVRRKLNAMPTVMQGKSVLLIDDSIVRGTTMTQIVDMVRKAGAKKARAPALLPFSLFAAFPAAHSRARAHALQRALLLPLRLPYLCAACCAVAGSALCAPRLSPCPPALSHPTRPLQNPCAPPFLSGTRRSTWPSPPPRCATPTSTAWTCPPARSSWPTG